MQLPREENKHQSDRAEVRPPFRHARRASIRVAINGYATALVPALFFAAFAVYLEWDTAAAALMFFGAAMPVFAFFDRIVVEDGGIRRSGILPRMWNTFRGRPMAIGFSDVEQVETQALRALRRGGQIFYRYRTTVVGGGARFVFSSGGRRYRAMVGMILPSMPESALDNRSIEIRDYLADPLDVLLRADIARIPGPEVLEDTLLSEEGDLARPAHVIADDEVPSATAEKALQLRRLANELRVSGYLLQALEAFRRAAVAAPKNAWILFEAARCLHSLGSANKDKRLQKKANALLRLAEMRANGDRELLSRVGECYFQFGEWSRARNAFQNAADTIEENFRALRGLAEIALREGKLAHVILHFRAASRIAETEALRRWSVSEAEYFSLLNGDESYLRKEIRRINRLDDMAQAKTKAFRIGFIGIPPLAFGFYFDDQMVAQIGWAVSGCGLLFWAGLQVGLNVLSSRKKGKV